VGQGRTWEKTARVLSQHETGGNRKLLNTLEKTADEVDMKIKRFSE
jgi:hypothetical protein